MPYDDCGKSISTTTRFSLKKIFFDLPIFTNENNDNKAITVKDAKQV